MRISELELILQVTRSLRGDCIVMVRNGATINWGEDDVWADLKDLLYENGMLFLG